MIIRIWNAATYSKEAGDEELQFESTEAPAPDDLIVMHSQDWLVTRRIYKLPILVSTEEL